MEAAANPLQRLAFSVPEQTARAASVAGRLFGAGLAGLVAIDQSYDPTQVFTVIVAILVVATLAPLGGGVSDILAGFGAGLVFFAGTVLTHLGPGLAMLAMGLLAGLAAFAYAHRNGRDVTLPAASFVAGVVFIGGLQAIIIFSFE